MVAFFAPFFVLTLQEKGKTSKKDVFEQKFLTKKISTFFQAKEKHIKESDPFFWGCEREKKKKQKQKKRQKAQRQS